MPGTDISIAPEERMLAGLTHLSGLAGYLIPLGGVLVPIVIWAVKKDSRIISSIARQALMLNVVVFVLLVVSVLMWLTIILIPVMWLFAALLGIVAVVLPIIGAIKAFDGHYYRNPIVGSAPA